MNLTKRQKMVVMLTEGPHTIWDLRKQIGGKVKDIVDDLEHIKKSLNKMLKIGPSKCLDCGFTTKKMKFVALSRCPKCKSERTSDPIIQIKD